MTPALPGSRPAAPAAAPLDDTPAGRLRRLARRLAGLAPSHRDPERYHLDKDVIVVELRLIARDIAGGSAVDLGRAGRPAVRSRVAAPASAVMATPAPSARGGSDCRHCLWRQAKQRQRHRLRLPGLDLFQWADRRDEARRGEP